jgi:hypothetical protein
MSVLRVKPLDQILSDAEGSGDHSLKRVLGAGDLISAGDRRGDWRRHLRVD